MKTLYGKFSRNAILFLLTGLIYLLPLAAQDKPMWWNTNIAASFLKSSLPIPVMDTSLGILMDPNAQDADTTNALAFVKESFSQLFQNIESSRFVLAGSEFHFSSRMERIRSIIPDSRVKILFSALVDTNIPSSRRFLAKISGSKTALRIEFSVVKENDMWYHDHISHLETIEQPELIGRVQRNLEKQRMQMEGLRYHGN
jgi:hypothetical protein